MRRKRHGRSVDCASARSRRVPHRHLSGDTAATIPVRKARAGQLNRSLVLDIALRLENCCINAGRSKWSSPDGATTSSRCRNGRARSPTAKAPTSSCRFTPTPAPAAGPRHRNLFPEFREQRRAPPQSQRGKTPLDAGDGRLPDFVKAIALNNKLDESRDFALHVQTAMVERQRPANKTLKDLGVKQAPFVVGSARCRACSLRWVRDQPAGGAAAEGNAYRQKIAEALFNASESISRR